MAINNHFDVIIIGGSYAGLSAAMALGRSLRNVLIIDSGKPCNRQTPHSHNFITHDGETPKAIADKAKEQVLKYDTVTFYTGTATAGVKTGNGFEIKTAEGESFKARKLLFATGITDLMPPIGRFAECWGISVLHCPYCHGYEVRHEKTGILCNGDMAFEFSKLILNWTKDLTLFTNGKSTLTGEQTEKLAQSEVKIIENEIESLDHSRRQISGVNMADGSKIPLKVLYARLPFVQHCEIPQTLGCELTEQGHLKIDPMQRTTVSGIFAAGDNSTAMRAVSSVIAAGTMAGAAINKELAEEEFLNQLQPLSSVGR